MSNEHPSGLEPQTKKPHIAGIAELQKQVQELEARNARLEQENAALRNPKIALKLLIDAIKSSDGESIRTFAPIASGSINQAYSDGVFHLNNHGFPPLCYALDLEEGDARDSIIEILKENGADLNETELPDCDWNALDEEITDPDDEGIVWMHRLLLHHSCHELRFNMFKSILEDEEHEFTSSDMDHLWFSITLAIQKTRESRKVLTEDPFREGGGFYKVLNYLLNEASKNKRLHVNLKLDSYDLMEETQLVRLVEKGIHPDTIRLFLSRGFAKHGVDYANIRDHWEKTPLFSARNAATVDLLVEFGAELDPLDDDGNTPLFKAVKQCRLEVVKYLADKCKCNVLHTNAKGQTLFHIMAMANIRKPKDWDNLIVWLKEKGLDLNARDADGYTPFQLACLQGQLELAKCFIAHGVNPHELTSQNKNVLDIFLSEGVRLSWKIYCELLGFLLRECLRAVVAKEMLGMLPELDSTTKKIFDARYQMQGVYKLIEQNRGKILTAEIKHEMCSALLEAIVNDPLLVQADFAKFMSVEGDDQFFSPENFDVLNRCLLRVYGLQREQEICSEIYTSVAANFFDASMKDVSEDEKSRLRKMAVLFFLCTDEEGRTEDQVLDFKLVFSLLANAAMLPNNPIEEFIGCYPHKSVAVLQELQTLYVTLTGRDDVSPCAHLLGVAQQAELQSDDGIFNDNEGSEEVEPTRKRDADRKEKDQTRKQVKLMLYGKSEPSPENNEDDFAKKSDRANSK